ncbi:unnamed protein product [Peronospora belbahrii]|uniref:HSF-type DNA-binding domain-containing protein n=1 Tax=Peronospora belbahrii TaxID=622444 RepID=A0AAU9KJV7_9STRA|nr:unnamed protein product [Peronospora belbahrii]CAH0515299.1 unnamed protein product [Peronospora belbahrii]
MMHRMRMQQLGIPERNVGSSKPSTLRAMRVPKFLRSLYDILQYEDQAILAWSEDGTHFQIFDTKRLETAVLPKYFKHGKFASFQRQLNNFGFRKWTKTQSSVCTFSHHHLVRCHPQQLADIISRRPPVNNARAVDDACSNVRRKQTVTELIRSADSAFSTATNSNTIKRKKDSYSRLLQPTDASDQTNIGFVKGAPRWATDPIGFLKTSEVSNGARTSMSSEQHCNFSVDELQDLILPLADCQDNRSVEKILCLELGTGGNVASNHGSELFSSPTYAWDSDACFSPVGRMHVKERVPWRLQ